MVYIEDLKQGLVIYNDNPVLGLICLEFVKQDGDKFVFVNDEGNEVLLTKSQLEIFSSSSDDAAIRRYQNESDMIVDEINKLNSQIDKLKNRLEKLNTIYGSLKDNYPEDFL